jgi:bile acid-coenzyme A ligase
VPSIPAAFRQLASDEPDRPAVTDQTGTTTRAELMQRATALAHIYKERGVEAGDLVTIGLPSDRSFVVAAVAAWLVGATPAPVPATMPAAELAAALEVAQPSLVVGVDGGAIPSILELPDTWNSAEELPDVTSPNWKALMSGGSTGRPKVIVAKVPAMHEVLTGLAKFVQMRPGNVALITAPMHHNGPFLNTFAALGVGGHAILPGRFDAETTLKVIERHRVGWVYLVPTMMSRILKLPVEVRLGTDVSSLHTVMHMAAPCPPYVKQAWIEWLGGEVIWELYAGTEGQASTLINGTEWLAHPGSVGRPVVGEMQIADEAGNVLPPGEVGEVWLRSPLGPTYSYLGATARTRADGWESLGDLGWMDEDGYLYLADRMTDMVLVGGSNVYPAEVEAALDEHPAVLSSCVIGLPDDDLGNRLHAIVQLSTETSDAELSEWCAQRLTKYKVPRTFERVDTPLRDEAAKVRRTQLRQERLAQQSG